MTQVLRVVAHDTLKSLNRVDGVECGKNQVPGESCRQCYRHRLLVTHLANQDNIRAFPNNVAKGGLERLCVGAHFSLGDTGTNVFVHKFDGFFDGDDVGLPGCVDVVNHGGHSR